jgi:hypothetical protein
MRIGFVAFSVIWLVSTLTYGAELSPLAKAEIDSLLDRLGTSQCQFYRNGSWYSASEARDHLKTKYDYLQKKGLIATSQDYIVAAGTKSSISGEPYKVQCLDHDPEPSAAWLGNQLQRLRENHGQ